MVPWVMKGSKKAAAAVPSIPTVDGKVATAVVEDKTFHRYYHLYRQGELETDIKVVGGVIVEAGYEKDNWWAIATPEAKT